MNPLEEAITSSQRLAPKTLEAYRHRVLAFLEFAGDRPKDWTPLRVEAWRDHMLKKGLTPQSVNLYIAAVQYAAKRMEKLGISMDFCRAAERARVTPNKEEPDVLTLQQTRALVATCVPEHHPIAMRDRSLILTGLHTGLRRAEICNIEIADVRGQKITAVVKGRKVHTVKLGDEPFAAMQVWLAWLAEQGVREGRVYRSVRPAVQTPWIVGKSLSPDGLAKILRARGQQIGIEDLHPHTLRHTFASLALQSGVERYRVMKILGHKTETMLDRYTHDLNDQAASAMFPSLTGPEGEDHE